MRAILMLLLFLFAAGSAAQICSAESVVSFQNELNREFKDSITSPLQNQDRLAFKGLDFFPYDASFCVSAKFHRTSNERAFKMKTTTTRTPEYVKFGELEFELAGKTMRLNVYQNLELSKEAGYEDYLFLPFSDATNGNQTYIGGRYIDMRIPSGTMVDLNFNLAYNPYCAYNYKYSCPIVPLENDLDISILAGVKKFHD